MTPERNALIDSFLALNDWGEGVRSALAGDASFRRYERVIEGPRTAVLMDAPPPEEDTRPFIAIARHLCKLGLSAPEIYATDVDQGLMLLEDLGDETYTRVLANGGDEETLYRHAVDVLIDLHRRPVTEVVPPGLASYGNGRLLDEAFLITQWTYRAFAGTMPDEATRRQFGDIWLNLFKHVHGGDKTLVLRDYHVDNLLWLPERGGIRSCGLLDFQDAVAGHPAYDLMSLLEDARRDIAGELKTKMMQHYFSAFADRDRASFETVFAVLAAQRHAKVIGIFTRLCQRDGKPDYLVHIPRVWGMLELALDHPALVDMKDWFDTHMPAAMRGIPPEPETGR